MSIQTSALPPIISLVINMLEMHTAITTSLSRIVLKVLTKVYRIPPSKIKQPLAILRLKYFNYF